MEEYDEAEIVWPDDGEQSGGDDYGGAAPAAAERRRAATSAPIPIARVGVSRSWGLGFTAAAAAAADDDDDDDDEPPPPHVVAARRSAAALSVCVGNGRTLKGRDLTHFRNSILRMTGFLEKIN